MTQPTDTPAFGKLFIDPLGSICIEGRKDNLVACAATGDEPDFPQLNPDVFPEIVRRWNLVAEAEAAEDGAHMMLATVIGERDAARADYAAESDQHDATAAALKEAEAERDMAQDMSKHWHGCWQYTMAENEMLRKRIAELEAQNSTWRQNSRDTWQAMCAMRDAINEWIAMPSIESDLLQGPENGVFCEAVADAVIGYIRRNECSKRDEPATGADTIGLPGSAANAQGAVGSNALTPPPDAELDDLTRRLNGEYRIQITDGLGAAGGEEPYNQNEFVRRFETPPIQKEAARAITAHRARKGETTAAARDVLAERRRQIEVEGWTPDLDDEYYRMELAAAASCYASPRYYMGSQTPTNWPWKAAWWKPTSHRRDLVKAGALILAEIERLDRAEARKGGAE